jgi:hypothetical protein
MRGSGCCCSAGRSARGGGSIDGCRGTFKRGCNRLKHFTLFFSGGFETHLMLCAEAGEGSCSAGEEAAAGAAGGGGEVKEWQMINVVILLIATMSSSLHNTTQALPPNTLTCRIAAHFQQLHSKSAGILLGDSSLAEPTFTFSDFSNSRDQSNFDGDRAGGLVHKQQRAATAAATFRLRRQ